MIKVRVVEAGGACETVNLPEDSTVADALRAARVRTDVQKTIEIGDQSLNGREEAHLDTIVNEEDIVYVIPQIKGN